LKSEPETTERELERERERERERDGIRKGREHNVFRAQRTGGLQ
jgi:hypothetical protein